MWEYIEIAVNLFQVVVIMQTITKYLGSKFDRLKEWICASVFTVILFIELMYVNSRVYFEGVAIAIPIGIIYIYALISLEGSWKKKLYSSVLIMLFVVGITSIVLNLIGIVGDYTYVNLIKEQNEARLIALFIIQILIFCVTRIYLYNKDVDVGEVSWDIWLMNIIISIISIVVLTFMLEISLNTTEKFRNKGIQMAVFASIGIFLINILIYLMYIKLKLAMAKKIEYELLKQQCEIQDKNIKDIKQLYSNFQKAKHDIKHHLNLLKTMLEKSESDEALKYLLNYTEFENSVLQDTIFCSNMIINYIINSKMLEMQKKNIHFYCDICDDITGITDVDVNIILGNLLDNAIEACEIVEDVKEISLSIYIRASYLVIIVRNTYRGNLEGLYTLTSTKKNQKEHGIGLRSVKDILKNYQGKLIIDNDEKQVMLKCIIGLDVAK